MSTYVFSFDRFKEKRKPHVNKSLDSLTSKTHYTGNKYLGILFAHFTPMQKNTSPNADKIFTISDGVSCKKALQITKANLISTTNPDAIKCSNNIEYRKSLLFSNIKPDLNTKTQMQDNIAILSVPAVEIQSRKIPPLRKELGSKISERIQQLQIKSPKNVKGLTLNTEFKFGHLNESPCNTSDATPKTPDVLFSNIKAPAFYDKKPPPPPAPAQSLKPKI